MSLKSLIEWTDATVNFWWGCTEVSPACAFCYAREWAKFSSRQLFGRVVEWGDGKERAERLEAAMREARKLNELAGRSGERLKVFANSMSDWLDDQVPIEWLAEMLVTIFLTRNLRWQLLTKRPENWGPRVAAVLAYWQRKVPLTGVEMGAQSWLEVWQDGDAPGNVWMGTTAEDQARADVRIPALLRIPAQVRFLSCEPLLGPVRIDRIRSGGDFWRPLDMIGSFGGIDWVICGGESGHHARAMYPGWARSLRDQCAASEVPFFFKQWGEWWPIDQEGDFDHFDGPQATMRHDGAIFEVDEPHGFCCADCSSVDVLRVGKKLAGRLLDGVEHGAFPGKEIYDSRFPVDAPAARGTSGWIESYDN